MKMDITTNHELRQRMERIVGSCIRGGMKDELIISLFGGLQKLVEETKAAADKKPEIKS